MELGSGWFYAIPGTIKVSIIQWILTTLTFTIQIFSHFAEHQIS